LNGPQFLKSLDQVDVAEGPIPPEKCGVTEQQLDAWFQEHDAIEKEVAAFDMGDLKMFKQQAKGEPGRRPLLASALGATMLISALHRTFL
jgi:hypothetical protein